MQTCFFKRTENSPWEVGLLFNEGSGIIIDKYGDKPGEVYDYKKGITHTSIPISILLDAEEQNIKRYIDRDASDK